ncbi:hypothetical protein SC29R_04950 [Aggregatibacter actinomycetemcomitans serotype f str. SC29R]|nr:hypothetical protein SC29R_04950 [Aggregatibacter actinomycetemcomitans serotype f str. SC29R]
MKNQTPPKIYINKLLIKLLLHWKKAPMLWIHTWGIT